jgi:hypothetical protein
VFLCPNLDESLAKTTWSGVKQETTTFEWLDNGVMFATERQQAVLVSGSALDPGLAADVESAGPRVVVRA